MIIEKRYSYARPTMIERVCPCCQYSNNDEKGFILLEDVYNRSDNEVVKLYACPKCGTVGIDVEKRG